ncbi:HTTM domain-containing protein [Urechidicola sp. KH5]
MNLQFVLNKLEKPIDIAPLVFARIILGLLITIEFSGGLFTKYAQTLITGKVHFSYMLTDFIQPWTSSTAIKAHFIVNLVLGILFALGFFYRWVTPLFLISGASLFLMEKSLYINHFYLYSLILLIFCFLPANRAYSIDSLRNPKIKASQVPAWTLYILLFQLSVVYIYAGFAKINSDWLQAQPVQLWLAKKAHFPIIGSYISTTSHAYMVAYGGIIFDLLIVPFMLLKRTRKTAFIIAIFFHISNVVTFGVGTFPWFSIAATSLFFAPSSFRKWKLKEKLPPIGFKTFKYGKQKNYIYLFFCAFIVIQLLIPLRHHLYPGNASWTEEGHFFAWRMMLRSKQSQIQFTVKDKKNNLEEIVRLNDHLNKRQISKMAGHPDMILQFAHYLKDYYIEHKNYDSPSVFAFNKVSLNGRQAQEMIDRKVDLSQEKRGIHHYSWILPLQSD